MLTCRVGLGGGDEPQGGLPVTAQSDATGLDQHVVDRINRLTGLQRHAFHLFGRRSGTRPVAEVQPDVQLQGQHHRQQTQPTFLPETLLRAVEQVRRQDEITHRIRGHSIGAEHLAVADLGQPNAGEAAHHLRAAKDRLGNRDGHHMPGIVLGRRQCVQPAKDRGLGLQAAVGPPTPQRSGQQQVQRQTHITGVRRTRGRRAKLQHPSGNTAGILIQGFTQPEDSGPIQAGQICSGSISHQAADQIRTARLEGVSRGADQSLTAERGRTAQLRSPLQTRDSRQDCPATQGLTDRRGKRIRDVVVRTGDRLCTMPGPPERFTRRQHVRQGAVGSLASDDRLPLQNARTHQRMTKPQQVPVGAHQTSRRCGVENFTIAVLTGEGRRRREHLDQIVGRIDRRQQQGIHGQVREIDNPSGEGPLETSQTASAVARYWSVYPTTQPEVPATPTDCPVPVHE